MARLAVTTGLLGVLVCPALAQTEGVAPKRVTVTAPAGTLGGDVRQIVQQTGIAVETAGAAVGTKVDWSVTNAPFWTALEELAAKTGHRIALGGKGQKIALVKHAGPPPAASVDGPFRVVVREVVARRDADTGRVEYEVKLDVHWEPRFPVFRIGNQTVTVATDDVGSKLTAASDPGKVPTTGFLMPASIRLSGVPRAAHKIAKLEGTFVVTAAEKMIRFAIDDPFKAPKSKTDSGVTVRLDRFAPDDGLWEAKVELTYPPGLPAFESFESWLTRNRCRLVAPGTGKTFEPTDYELPAGGARLVAAYRFKEDAAKGLTPKAGWTLEYETPSPLKEYTVKFALKDIVLP
ncbi:MAG TPA: hypothetical protein VGJ05_03755 [Fimbriiglobus sp.]|jgi:hypothetical protein